jgi:hypothetical protein
VPQTLNGFKLLLLNLRLINKHQFCNFSLYDGGQLRQLQRRRRPLPRASPQQERVDGVGPPERRLRRRQKKRRPKERRIRRRKQF